MLPVLITYLLLLLVAREVYGACRNPAVKLTDGIVEGTFDQSFNGRPFMQFLGIPYAKPPVGALRFREAEPVDPWLGVIIANRSTACIQIEHQIHLGGIVKGVEDCLHVNVYIPGPRVEKNSDLDVVVHIHGGAFMFGCGVCSTTGPKFLMDRDLIYVTFNYRLGVFGFLSTEDDQLPGNLGMKDQLLALKWVKKNIKCFGGNSKSITLTGFSAGGASVHYHMLSPLSRSGERLFHRAISVSGCALNPWTLQEHAKEKAISIGAFLGCPTTNTKLMVECLRTRHATALIEATRILRLWLFNPFTPLGIVVDAHWTKTPFLPDHPMNLLSDGHTVGDVPWILSTTTAEGLYPAVDFLQPEMYLIDLDMRWNEVAPYILHYYDTAPKRRWPEIGQKIRNFYMGNRAINLETFNELVEALSDHLFVAGCERCARLHAMSSNSTVHFYQYNYTSEIMFSINAFAKGKPKKIYGAGHGDDAMFLFSTRKVTPLSCKDQQMLDFFLDLWKTFAHSGATHIRDWKPVSMNPKDPLKYLCISALSSMEMHEAKQMGNRLFWDQLPVMKLHKLSRNIKDEL